MIDQNLQVALQWAAAGVPIFPVQVFATEKGKIEKVPRVKWRDLCTTDSRNHQSLVETMAGQFAWY